MHFAHSLVVAVLALAASVSAGTINQYDGSNSPISLVDAWPQILSPKAGETYHAGGNLTVTWCVPALGGGGGDRGSLARMGADANASCCSSPARRSQSLADKYDSSEIGQTASISLFYTKNGSSTHLDSKSLLAPTSAFRHARRSTRRTSPSPATTRADLPRPLPSFPADSPDDRRERQSLQRLGHDLRQAACGPAHA